MATTADAIARETAWLRTGGDGLPALEAANGGPFDVVQAYFPRTPASEQRSLFVMRNRLRSVRFANIRNMAKHHLLLRLWWPAVAGDGAVESDQQALDDAVELVFARIGGTLGDKTHGGRFLSVAESGDQEATFHDPMRSLPEVGALICDITYDADDYETIG